MPGLRLPGPAGWKGGPCPPCACLPAVLTHQKIVHVRAGEEDKTVALWETAGEEQ